MRITEAEVRHIARLAQLELTDATLARMGEQLTKILDYIDQLKDVDISAVTLTSDEATPLADDVVRTSLGVEAVAANAPRFVHGHFVVPKVIGGE